MRSCLGRRLCAPAILLMISASASQGEVDTFVEDFTTTTYKDAATTTADWNTGAGQLKLFLFSPTVKGLYDTPGIAVGAYISGDHAYVADSNAGLQVIDISDPSAPPQATVGPSSRVRARMCGGARPTPGHPASIPA